MTIYHGDNNHPAQKEPRETGFDWQKSPAHLRLLSKFLRPRVAEDFSKRSGYWQKELGETPQKAIERFLDEGVSVHADFSEHLTSKFKVTELKGMLEVRGLPVSGRKSELISRLVQADPEGMEKAVTKLTLLHCSERGREIVGRGKKRKKSVFPRRKIVPIDWNYVISTMIVTAIGGAIAIWWLGGGGLAGVTLGALIGAGAGFLLVGMIVQPLVNAIAGDFLSILRIGVSMIGAIIGARLIWEGSGGNLTLTIIGAFGGMIGVWIGLGWILARVRGDIGPE